MDGTGIDYTGRIVAAERNALAAIEHGKHMSKRMALLEAQVKQLSAKNAQLEQRLNAMQGQIVAMMGNGATSR